MRACQLVPTLLACLAAASSTDGQTFTYSGSIQTYTVPATGTYAISVWGAQGGGDTTYLTYGGLGATMSGDVSLTQGTVLDIVVGQQGQSSHVYGGGGSFVYVAGASQPLVVAGGGGGYSGGSSGGYETGYFYGGGGGGGGSYLDPSFTNTFKRAGYNSGNGEVTIAAVDVPEPGTLALVGCGAAALVIYRWPRRRRRERRQEH